MSANSQPKSIVKLVASLLATGVGMFAFAVFVMPPIYDVFCDITGLNGKTEGRYSATEATPVDEKRTVKVQFIAKNNETMPWQFQPVTSEIRVHPGEPTLVSYYAKNPTQADMVGQAIPSLVPFAATRYFHKTECFCFNSQPLAAGEEAELVLQFIVDPELPEHINTLTLAYTVFDITGTAEPRLEVSTSAGQ
ncbi:cytochrome c oxidase assembly protein [Halioxenophilus aromaticivorans]|uniref:Cytochrome c oxidase assembly protein CtaG n=1 Tax=Halioxenophilus aromaticivorans TaxID=1306992 RepID=A0AAV3U914_9ALTE